MKTEGCAVRWATIRSWTLAACLSVTLLVAVAGCGGSSDDSKGGAATAASTAGGATSLEGKRLVVASWGGSWTEASKKYFFEPFEKETGAKVIVETPGGGFNAQVTAQEENQSVEWDLLDAPGLDLHALALKGYLANFPAATTAAIKPLVVDGALRPTANPHYLAYGATTLVIACNPKLVKKCPKTPADYFDTAGFPGTRGMNAGSPASVLQFALEADGVPKDQLFPLDIPRAIAKLKSIKSKISVWNETPSQGQQTLADGEVAISVLGNSLANQVPGITMSFDGAPQLDEGWCVVKDAPNADVAFAFLQWFAKHPEQQVLFAKSKGSFVPALDAAKRLSPEALASSPIGKDAQVVVTNGEAAAKQSNEVGDAFKKLLAG